MDLKSILAVMGVVWRRGQGTVPDRASSIYPVAPATGAATSPAAAPEG